MFAEGGDLPRPTDEVVELLGVTAAWPAAGKTNLDGIADQQKATATSYDTLGQNLHNAINTHGQLIRGKTGDAHQAFLGGMRDDAYGSSDHYDSREKIAREFGSAVDGLQTALTQTYHAAK